MSELFTCHKGTMPLYVLQFCSRQKSKILTVFLFLCAQKAHKPLFLEKKNLTLMPPSSIKKKDMVASGDAGCYK